MANTRNKRSRLDAITFDDAGHLYYPHGNRPPSDEAIQAAMARYRAEEASGALTFDAHAENKARREREELRG